MIKRENLLLLFLLSTFISSCENEIPFNKEANPPKLIMNALINADSTNNVLYLNKSGQNVISHVTDASVEIRVNDALVETPEAETLSYYHKVPPWRQSTYRCHDQRQCPSCLGRSNCPTATNAHRTGRHSNRPGQ